jgi:WD40 repeat protein
MKDNNVKDNCRFHILPFKYDEFNIDPELVVGDLKFLKPQFICTICKYFVMDPRLCSQCQTIFCQKCISKFSNQNGQRCPNHCDNFTEVELNKSLKNILNLMEIKCPSNHVDCQSSFIYENFKAHLSECQYIVRELKCLCPCNATIKSKLKSIYELYRGALLKCKICFKFYNPEDSAKHEDNYIIECLMCKKHILHKDQVNHAKECHKNIEEFYKRRKNKYKNQINYYQNKIQLPEEGNKKEDKIICYKNFQGHMAGVACLLAIKVDKDDSIIVTGGCDNDIKVWDLEKEKCLRTIKAHKLVVSCLIKLNWTKSNTTVVSASWDTTIKLWNYETGERLKTLRGHLYFITGLAQVNNKKPTLVSTSLDNTIKVWDIDSGDSIKVINNSTFNYIHCMIEYDGSIIFGGRDSIVKLWNLSLNKCEKQFTGHTSWITTIADIRHPKERKVIATGSADKTIKLWDMDKSEPLISTLAGHGDTVSGLSYVVIGKLYVLISASYDKTVKLWNLENNNLLNSYTAHSDWISSVITLEFRSKKKTYLLTSSYDKSVKMWDITK